LCYYGGEENVLKKTTSIPSKQKYENLKFSIHFFKTMLIKICEFFKNES